MVLTNGIIRTNLLVSNWDYRDCNGVGFNYRVRLTEKEHQSPRGQSSRVLSLTQALLKMTTYRKDAD
jgi:hypothetical protein